MREELWVGDAGLSPPRRALPRPADPVWLVEPAVPMDVAAVVGNGDGAFHLGDGPVHLGDAPVHLGHGPVQLGEGHRDGGLTGPPAPAGDVPVLVGMGGPGVLAGGGNGTGHLLVAGSAAFELAPGPEELELVTGGAALELIPGGADIDLVTGGADLERIAGDGAGQAPGGGDPAAPGQPGSGPGISLSSVGRLATRALHGARDVATDPRLSGLLRAGPSVATFMARTRERSAGAAHDATVLRVRATPGLALHAYLDEVLIAMFRHPELMPKAHDYAPAASDLEKMHALFDTRGWLDHPTLYHRAPPPPRGVETSEEHRQGIGFEHVTFRSGWEPDPQEIGRDRWLAHEANRTVHAWMSRVPDRHQRSWLVCTHGLGMGNNPAVDLRSFRAPQLARRGINVVLPVLPLHGPRASGRARGEDLMSIDMIDSLHGVAQAVWDVRRLVRWLRRTQGAEQIGVMGYSLGGLVASLVASIEDDLTCVIAGIPVVDLPHLFRHHSPPHIARLADTHGVLGPVADDVHRVVSPLAMECRVPFDRRFIFAGLADRMSTFGHARRLWLHWGQPALATYPGGHVGFYWSGAVKRFVDDALSRSYANVRAA